MRRWVLPVLASLAGEAMAHGGDPYLTSIHVRPGAEHDVIAGTTFGLLVTHDGGATWRWICEYALHYLDPRVPDYGYAPNGAMFLQSVTDGVRVNRDGCTFEPTSLGTLFASRIEVGPDGALYAAASAGDDNAIYRSTDDGVSFPQTGSAGQAGDVWESLEVAPTDAQRVYLTGYRISAPPTREPLLLVSTNGGATFAALPTTDFETTPDSILRIVQVGTTPDTVYAHVSYDAAGEHAIYKSLDGGTTWTRIFTTDDIYGLSFLARASGELVAATRASGAWRSSDGGSSWAPLVDPPHISVMIERANGEVWAGTQTFSFPNRPPFPSIPPDGFAIMRSTDLVTWTPVLAVQDIAGPVDCPAGTLQRDKCVDENLGLGTAWCCVSTQLQITSTEHDCTGPNSCALIADGMAGDVTLPPPDGGCCQSGPDGRSWPLAALTLLMVVRRRPR